MQVNRAALVKGIPLTFSGRVVSLQPIENTKLLLVEIDYEGIDVRVPLDRNCIAQLLSKKGVISADPGETLPKYTKRSASSGSKVGPKVGTIKEIKGVKKRLVKYDFVTPKLKGKRRVACPETGKKGFPIWERV